MAMGTREGRRRQEGFWLRHDELATAPGHPFYQRLNQLLDQEKFDQFAEGECAQFYAEKNGRPSLSPGMYFRSLLIGYFEGIDTARTIAWRLADSLALRQFLQIGLDERTPDHSTISRTRRLIDLETHRKVFGWVLGLLADRGLLKGKMVGIDATTLEANAAMRSIVRRDNGQRYEAFLTELAKKSGIATPTREDLARIDRKRKKKRSNQEWESATDPDARITKMKDGSTHMAHKAEHAVDLGAGGHGAILAVNVCDAAAGDTATLADTLVQATANLRAVSDDGRVAGKVDEDFVAEAVLDKGYHSRQTLLDLEEMGVRSYASEPGRARQDWAGQADARDAVYANRRRIRGERGKRLLRSRGERLERTFAHCYETGGMRRLYLRGRGQRRQAGAHSRGRVQHRADDARALRPAQAAERFRDGGGRPRARFGPRTRAPPARGRPRHHSGDRPAGRGHLQSLTRGTRRLTRKAGFRHGLLDVLKRRCQSFGPLWNFVKNEGASEGGEA
jgi:Transposase and inactivated derivatives